MSSNYQTNYIRRRGGAGKFLAVLAVFILCVSLFVGVFWWNGREYAGVSLSQTYYFLVRDCEDTTASAVAGEVYFSGGAGYLLETGGKNSVVLACYFSQVTAESVRRTVTEKGVEARVLALSPERFSLNGKSAAQARRIEMNAETADTCAHILYDTANALERTEYSQEEARAAVRGVVKALKGLRIGNGEKGYSEWNAALASAERKGTEIAEGIVFAKDLRYLQTQLCFSVVNIADYF